MIKGNLCITEVGSGSEFSIILEHTSNELLEGYSEPLVLFDPNLTDFQGNAMKMLGACYVHVEYGDLKGLLKLLVVKGHWTSLLEMNWFKPLGSELAGMHSVWGLTMKCVLEKFHCVLRKKFGKLNSPPSHFPWTLPSPIWMRPLRTQAKDRCRAWTRHLEQTLSKVFLASN